MLIIFAMAIGGFLLMLLLLGVVGPKRIKERIRRLIRWYSYDAELFLPLDPYKPISKALKEGVENFMPTKQRLLNFLYVNLGVFLLFLGLTLLLIVLDVLRSAR